MNFFQAWLNCYTFSLMVFPKIIAIWSDYLPAKTPSKTQSRREVICEGSYCENSSWEDNLVVCLSLRALLCKVVMLDNKIFLYLTPLICGMWEKCQWLVFTIDNENWHGVPPCDNFLNQLLHVSNLTQMLCPGTICMCFRILANSVVPMLITAVIPFQDSKLP